MGRIKVRTPVPFPHGRRFQPCLEQLEDRSLLSGLAVTDVTQFASTPDEAAQILASDLTGGLVPISNAHFTGLFQQPYGPDKFGYSGSSAGTFTGGTGILGADFESGIILSSGLARSVVGPNQSSSTSHSNGLSGDADLTSIAGAPTYDATILEFDFIPDSTQVSFQYVFGSEEYTEFVQSFFNDAFEFILNGQNIALLPGTSTPVSIHTVNQFTNTGLFINNDVFSSANHVNPAVNIECDGLTVVLTATGTVIPGQVNHIKLAISDAGDSVFDSNVFLKIGGFVGVFDKATATDDHPNATAVSPDGAVTAELQLGDNVLGAVTLTVTNKQPEGSPPPVFAVAIPDGTGVAFYDVPLKDSIPGSLNADLSNATVTITFNIPDEITSALTLLWFNDGTKTWQPVLGANGLPPTFDFVNHTGFVVLNNTSSSPLLVQLGGTVFSVVVPNSQPTPAPVAQPVAIADPQPTLTSSLIPPPSTTASDTSFLSSVSQNATFSSSTQLNLALSPSQESQVTTGVSSGGDEAEDVQIDVDKLFWLLLLDNTTFWQQLQAQNGTPVPPVLEQPAPVLSINPTEVAPILEPAQPNIPEGINPGIAQDEAVACDAFFATEGVATLTVKFDDDDRYLWALAAALVGLHSQKAGHKETVVRDQTIPSSDF